MELSAAVMSHPSRADAARSLLERLEPLEPSLALDPDPDGPPSALAASLLAWGGARTDATHHLVVQDDAELVPDAVDRIRSSITERPDDVLVHYVGWSTASAQLVRASGALPHWGEIVDPYLPAVCVSMPADLARDIARRPPTSLLDDVNLRHALAERGREVWACYPSAADHGQLPSLVGNDRQGSRGAVSRGGGDALAGSTTDAVSAFPVIDRRGGDGQLLLRWLERGQDVAWRVRSVNDGLRAAGEDPVEVVRTAAERARELAGNVGAEVNPRDLALLWLACRGTVREASRVSRHCRRTLDPAAARLNLEHAIAEWTGVPSPIWSVLVDDAFDDARSASEADARLGLD